MVDTVDIAIVGGGAAGLATALSAAETWRASQGSIGDTSRRRIVIFEGAKQVGAKILVSGGGRCNVTHDAVTETDYHGKRTIIRNILRSFGVAEAQRWFAEMGVELKREETGKLFPVTDSARTVVGALLRRAGELGVEIRTGCRVEEITVIHKGDANVFRLAIEGGEVAASRVVLAAGGRSLPRTGSDGWGYGVAKRLGHGVGVVAPALVPLRLAEGFIHKELMGISTEVQWTSTWGGKKVDERRGAMLFTHFGVSGPVAMDASRFWTLGREQGETVEARVDFMMHGGIKGTEAWLLDQATRHGGRRVAQAVAERLPARLGGALCKLAGLGEEALLREMTKDQRKRFAGVLGEMVLPIIGDRGWNYAEVSAGGVDLGEVRYQTMESRVVKGLYLVGEVLDCDGRIGGFNFQWAWATGHQAGTALGRWLGEEKGG